VIGSGGNSISSSKVGQGINETGFADASGNSCVGITYEFFKSLVQLNNHCVRGLSPGRIGTNLGPFFDRFNLGEQELLDAP
jgi:hypothetical protein